jgi:hypothetical protein
MRRNKHSLSHYHLLTCDMGELVPVGCIEVLPGDTFQQQTSALVRVTPQLKPLMHPVQVRLHHFFVPNRLLWSGWEDFITGKSETPPPTISGGTHTSGSLIDYLGVYDDASTDFSALPVRAYNLIYNEFYRDQDLITEVSTDSTTLQKVSWAKDYFTSSRPWSQKGDAVTIPIGETAPINFEGANGDHIGIHADDGGDGRLQPSDASSNTWQSTAPLQGNYIYADLSQASAVDVRDFREAFALQRYQEARSRYGSRYTEYLRYLGIRPSDARLQRPEYLGGGRQTIAFSEVLNTASNGGTDPIGEFGGHGIAALRSNRYRRFFEEHGFVITLMSVRPRSIYTNGIHKKFTRTTKEDYYQKELESIGQQEIYNRELYAAHTNPDSVFGYTDRYREYKEEPSRVSGNFHESSEYDWHMGRIFSSDIALNQSFVECLPTKRCFAEQSNDSLFVMVNHSVQARRMVKRNPASRII